MMAVWRRKPDGEVIVHSDSNNADVSLYHPLSLPFNQIGVITDAVKTFPHPDSHSDRPFVSCPGPVGCRKRLHAGISSPMRVTQRA